MSPDDRHILYRFDDKKSLRIYDRNRDEIFSKSFDFDIEELIVSPFMEFKEAMRSIYLITTSPSDDSPDATLVRELFMYNFPGKSLTAISTAGDTELQPYLRNP